MYRSVGWIGARDVSAHTLGGCESSFSDGAHLSIHSFNFFWMMGMETSVESNESSFLPEGGYEFSSCWLRQVFLLK